MSRWMVFRVCIDPKAAIQNSGDRSTFKSVTTSKVTPLRGREERKIRKFKFKVIVTVTPIDDELENGICSCS